MKLVYKKVNYKYILQEDVVIKMPREFLKISLFNLPAFEFETDFFSYDLTFNTNSKYNVIIHVKKGYAWDGASGCAIDTDNFMLPALIHDVMYQMLREYYCVYTDNNGYELSSWHEDYRKGADKILYRLCRSHRMSLIRSSYVYLAVRLFGKSAAIQKKSLITVLNLKRGK